MGDALGGRQCECECGLMEIGGEGRDVAVKGLISPEIPHSSAAGWGGKGGEECMLRQSSW